MQGKPAGTPDGLPSNVVDSAAITEALVRIMERQKARTRGGPGRTEQRALDLPLPGPGSAPSGGLTTNRGLTTNSIRTGLRCH
jgi:hypothetical protein